MLLWVAGLGFDGAGDRNRIDTEISEVKRNYSSGYNSLSLKLPSPYFGAPDHCENAMTG